ncbi:hypothetical protein NDU88_007754 [Pleurodeles waltl]|uniref:Uncharacterized protein n=1 Tax=Pleurodeles waltl TaxID=8319 RepID=A0AAV7ST75_PLEWA|nr:hypothetical protein NDU88_007754 [Pleurodeles waltl]
MAATAADALVRVYSGALVSASAPSRSLRLTQCVPSHSGGLLPRTCPAPEGGESLDMSALVPAQKTSLEYITFL